ncbi:MAG: DUF192 domain-containing protein [Marinovum sp.]|nr:DUF192 domain-containing protein [Marinovum sp.]
MGTRDKIHLMCAAAFAAVLTASQAIAACVDTEVTLRGPFGAKTFAVELALTPAEKNRGLMFRRELGTDSGMLFFFDPPRRVSFWMRNTLIPLDMIFIDARGVVRKVHANAVPGDETGIPGAGPTRAVLELNGGRAAEIGITEGALVQHAMFDQTRAALPCPME